MKKALLLGYCIRGREPLLIAISAIVGVCFVVQSAIALSELATQTSVPVVIGLNHKTAEIKLR